MPHAVAVVTGAALKHPERFRDRPKPKDKPLGTPPKHLAPGQREMWLTTAGEVPWLAQADRLLLEATAILRDQLRTDNGLTAPGYAQLRQFLALMGATPVTRTKVAALGTDEPDDPASQFFN